MDKERMRIAVQYIFKKGAWPIVANSSENERVRAVMIPGITSSE